MSLPAHHAEAPVYDSARRPPAFLEELLDLWKFRELVFMWSLRTIKIRYKRSVLGVLWTLIEPLTIMIILTIVFSALFRFDLDNYPVYVLVGLTLFDFFRRATVAMVEEITASQGLASKIHVPRSAFPVSAVITYLINWMLAMIPLAGIMLFLDHPFTPALASLPAGIVLNVLFALGVGLVVATLAAFFPDVSLTYQVVLTAWMYATPIIYPIEIVDESYRPVILLNPMTYLLRTVRDPVFEGRASDPSTWAISAVATLVALLVGWWSFTRWRDAFDYRA